MGNDAGSNWWTRLRTWWTSLSTRMDDRWPNEPEDNLPGR